MSALPYDFYPAVLYALEQLSQGQTKSVACDNANISIATFEQYVARDQNLQVLYIDAERRGHDAMADALLHPDNNSTYGQTNPQMAKVVSDNIKWFLSKKDGKRFGDKIEIKHEFTMDRAITDAIDAGKRRVHAAHTIEHIPDEVMDVVVETVEDELAELLR